MPIDSTISGATLRTSDSYTPVICFYPDGTEMRTSTLKGRELDAKAAIAQLTLGQHASTPFDQADTVRAWLHTHKTTGNHRP